MPIITSIKQQKKKDRVDVYLDGKFGFGIDLINLVKFNLKLKKEITNAEVKKNIKKAEFQKILDKLLRFASVRPRSEKEIRNYLKRKKIPVGFEPDLIIRLKKLEMFDDLKFTRWWVEQRQAFRPKPKRVLKGELLLKGVKNEIIEDVLEKEEIDEEEIAKKLLEKRAYKWEGLSVQEARQKKSAYLVQKGFEWETIGKVIDLDTGKE